MSQLPLDDFDLDCGDQANSEACTHRVTPEKGKKKRDARPPLYLILKNLLRLARIALVVLHQNGVVQWNFFDGKHFLKREVEDKGA